MQNRVNECLAVGSDMDSKAIQAHCFCVVNILVDICFRDCAKHVMSGYSSCYSLIREEDSCRSHKEGLLEHA